MLEKGLVIGAFFGYGTAGLEGIVHRRVEGGQNLESFMGGAKQQGWPCTLGLKRLLFLLIRAG